MNGRKQGMGARDDGIELAAVQQISGTIPAAARPLLWIDALGWRAVAASPMTTTIPRKYYIKGLTTDGRTFRPSDWAERLAGAMSCFRPGGAKATIGSHIGYSPFCVPRVIGSTKCVIVDEALKGVEPMAWDFVMNFARDNDLQVEEAPR